MLGAGLLMATGGGGYSAAAQDYIDRVIAADVAAGNSSGLETGVMDAYAAFIDGLIADGYLGTSAGVISQSASVIKASCIMAGARTLSGCLVPLVGTAPTNNNLLASDYDRKLGPLGNSSNTRYLISNRANNADPQNNKHLSVYVSQVSAFDTTRVAIGAGGSTSGASGLLGTSNTKYYRINYTSGVAPNLGSTATLTGFWGASRASSTTVSGRQLSTNYSFNDNSSVPVSDITHVFARQGGSIWNGRLSFYSIGESLNLATLDTRVTTLINAIAAAIP